MTGPSLRSALATSCPIPAGHDGWTIGDEPCVVLDFSGMANYAKPS